MNEKEILYRKPPKRNRSGRLVVHNSRDRSEKIFGIVYCRVSSETQKRDGHGLESQEHRCRDFAKAKGYEVEAVFQDSFTGGGDFTKRPAMAKMLSYIDSKSHRNYVVIFDDISRLARDVGEHIKLRATFRRRSIDLLCLNYSFDDSPEGEFAEVVMAGNAELFRKQNRRQVIQKQKARLEAGYWPFGPRTGYKHIRSRQHGVLAVPTEQVKRTLQPALEMFATGLLQRKIDVCRFLAEKEFWKKQKPEKYIDKITNIMLDPFYCGDISYERWEVSRRKGHHEGIISAETYEIIQRRLKRGEVARLRIDTSPDFPLRRLILCEGCKKPMTAAWSQGNTKRYGYYFCQNKECPICRKCTFRREKVESDFILLLKRNRLKKGVEKLVSLAFETAWKEEMEYSVGRERLIAEQAKKAKERVRQLIDLVVDTKREELKAAYSEQLEEAYKEQKSLDALKPMTSTELAVPYQTALNKSMLMLKKPDKAWKKMNVFEKQQLFFFIFEEKLLYSKNGGYQTAENACATRLFEEFAEQNTRGCGGAGN